MGMKHQNTVLALVDAGVTRVTMHPISGPLPEITESSYGPNSVPLNVEILPLATDVRTFMHRLYQLSQDAQRIEFDSLSDAVNASALCDLLQERIQQSVEVPS
jgi:hypothetical protein